jgi:hypothetical protein
VVWTDCFQVMVLYASMFAVLIKGTLDIGGVAVVWERNYQTGRSDFFKYVVVIKRYLHYADVWYTSQCLRQFISLATCLQELYDSQNYGSIVVMFRCAPGSYRISIVSTG